MNIDGSTIALVFLPLILWINWLVDDWWFWRSYNKERDKAIERKYAHEEDTTIYLVCRNEKCRATYDFSKFEMDDKNITCEKCSHKLISNSGRMHLTSVENHPKN